MTKKEDEMNLEENKRLGRYYVNHQDEFVIVGSVHRKIQEPQKSQPEIKPDPVGNVFKIFGCLIVLLGILALFFMLIVVGRFL